MWMIRLKIMHGTRTKASRRKAASMVGDRTATIVQITTMAMAVTWETMKKKSKGEVGNPPVVEVGATKSLMRWETAMLTGRPRNASR